MAYRFDASSNKIRFAISPLSGYTVSPFTMAIFLKRNSLGVRDLIDITDSSDGDKILFFANGNPAAFFIGSTSGGPNITNTALWYLLVVTRAGGTGQTRFHLHDGTSWTHATTGGGLAAGTPAIGGTDRIWMGKYTIAADVVCAGIKKADSSDLAVETLSRTAFSAWQSFGFDWLIGFDSSLESAGALQDQASPGTGDEMSRVGTISLVSDPPGWSWAPAAPAFVPQVTII